MNQNKEQPPMIPALARWVISNAPPSATDYDRNYFVFMRMHKGKWVALNDNGQPNGLIINQKDATPISIAKLIEVYDFDDAPLWMPESRPHGYFELFPVLDEPAKPPVITNRTLFLFCVFALVVMFVQWGASCAM